MERHKIKYILEGIRDGVIKADDLKKLLHGKSIDPNHIPFKIPDGPQTEIKIRTTFEHVILNYPCDPEDIQVPLPGGPGYVKDIPIVIAKRSDNRFKHLDCDSEYLVLIPGAGIEILDLPRYYGPMTFRQEVDEKFFDY